VGFAPATVFTANTSEMPIPADIARSWIVAAGEKLDRNVETGDVVCWVLVMVGHTSSPGSRPFVVRGVGLRSLS
jgi:hypothetical protein